MSSSLDKLRALSSRLETKLEQKGQLSLFDAPEPEEVAPAPQMDPEPLAPQTIELAPVVVAPTTQEAPPAPTPPVATAPQTQTPAPTLQVFTDDTRDANMDRLKALYLQFNIADKTPQFEDIFLYKAMNLSGIGLKEDDFAQARDGKYIQVIAITYEPDISGKKRAKNISLGYFGKSETLEPTRKNEIIEFVLRWRYEKAFQNLDHYKGLLAKL
jgi:hypothetical protein